MLLVFPRARPRLFPASGAFSSVKEPSASLPHRDHHHVSAVGDPPGPEVGALLGLLQLVALFVIGTRLPASQSRGPPPLLVHQGEDPLPRRPAADDGVELLGDLVDGVGKALGQLQEAGANAQGDGGVPPPLRARVPPTIATITYWTLPMFTMIGTGRMLA